MGGGAAAGHGAEVEHALVAAQRGHVDHAAGLLAGVDGAVGRLIPGCFSNWHDYSLVTKWKLASLQFYSWRW